MGEPRFPRAGRVRQLEYALSVLDLFQHPTVSALAELLTRSRTAPDSLADIEDEARLQVEAVRRRRAVLEQELEP